MTIARGFLITFFSGVACACIGAILGFLIGFLAPDYYRLAVGLPRELSVNYAQMGFVGGFLQGLMVGLLIGLVIVVTVAWQTVKSRPVQ